MFFCFRGHKNIKRQPTGLTKEVSSVMMMCSNCNCLNVLNHLLVACYLNRSIPCPRTLQMCAEGRTLLERREMWTVSPAWAAPGYYHIYIEGIQHTLSSKVTYNKHVCQKKVKQYIAVGTVRMFMEPSAKH